MSAYEQAWKLEGKCFNDPFIQEQLSRVREGTGYDPFFPPKGTGPGKWAKTYCRDCPVRLACLAEAMKSLDSSYNNHYDGIWGGLTPHGRSVLKRRNRESAQRILAQMKELFPDTDTPNAS